MKNATIYCFSGLGVDARAFKKIDLPEAKLIHVPWIHFQRNESMESYAKRLFETVSPEKGSLLIGVSFGGMIANEWLKLQDFEQVVLISSATHRAQIPLGFHMLGRLGLYRIVGLRTLLRFKGLVFHFFGVKEGKDKKLLLEILRDTDPQFVRDALHAILHWQPQQIEQAISIHGTEDRLIRCPANVSLLLEGGGHFSILTHGAEITNFIRNQLT